MELSELDSELGSDSDGEEGSDAESDSQVELELAPVEDWCCDLSSKHPVSSKGFELEEDVELTLFLLLGLN